MFIVNRTIPLAKSCVSLAMPVLTRSFVAQTPEQKKRVEEYNRKRKQYKLEVGQLRKQYAEESNAVEQQHEENRQHLFNANEDKMRIIGDEHKRLKKNNMRFHYEHLCDAQIMKSIRQVNGLINLEKNQVQKNKHLKKMLDLHMPMIYHAYKEDEVETRVLKEMKEVVPVDRVFMAPPNWEVNEADYLSYEDYEKLVEFKEDKSEVRMNVNKLINEWKEEKKSIYNCLLKNTKRELLWNR